MLTLTTSLKETLLALGNSALSCCCCCCFCFCCSSAGLPSSTSATSSRLVDAAVTPSPPGVAASHPAPPSSPERRSALNLVPDTAAVAAFCLLLLLLLLLQQLLPSPRLLFTLPLTTPPQIAFAMEEARLIFSSARWEHRLFNSRSGNVGMPVLSASPSRCLGAMPFRRTPWTAEGYLCTCGSLSLRGGVKTSAYGRGAILDQSGRHMENRWSWFKKIGAGARLVGNTMPWGGSSCKTNERSAAGWWFCSCVSYTSPQEHSTFEEPSRRGTGDTPVMKCETAMNLKCGEPTARTNRSSWIQPASAVPLLGRLHDAHARTRRTKAWAEKDYYSSRQW